MPIVNPGAPRRDGIGLLENSESVIVESLLPGASHVFTLQLDRALIYRVIVSHPLRLRLYSNAILRDDDLPRIVTEMPIKGRGLILELVSSAGFGDLILSPPVWAIASEGALVAGVIQSRAPDTATMITLFNYLR